MRNKYPKNIHLGINSINKDSPNYWRRYKENKSYEDEPPKSSYQLREDEVNSPAHYNTGKVECIEAIEAMLTPEEYLGYLRGNSLKYLWRFRYKKSPHSDLLKAQWYEEKLLDFYTENETLFLDFYKENETSLEIASGDGTESGEDC
jgi:hypothetical protein